MTHDRVKSLRLERRLPGIGHQVHADGLPGFRVHIRQCPGLQDNWPAAGDDVLEIRRGARTAVNGYGGFGALQPVFGTGVTSRRIAHHLDRELHRFSRTVRILWRPRKRYPEQSALEQERMRTFFILRQPRTIGAVECSEYRVLTVGQLPALL